MIAQHTAAAAKVMPRMLGACGSAAQAQQVVVGGQICHCGITGRRTVLLRSHTPSLQLCR